MNNTKKLLAFLFTLCAVSAPAQYSIGWSKIAGGGGNSSGGSFSVSGTVGQVDASPALTGGNYSVTGGFWSIINVVQTSGSPLLTIASSANNILISWPYPSTGFVLQQNSNLNSTNWAVTSLAIDTNSSVNSVSITAPTGSLFFRLSNQ
jgi:hypothetical protein